MLQDGAAEGIFAQRFDGSGARFGTELQVNVYTLDAQIDPDVATDPQGGFIAVWSSNGEDGQAEGIFGRRFNSAGAPIGGEFQVNTYTYDRQRRPRVALDAMGRFLVVWRSSFQDGDGSGIFARRFEPGGTPIGDDFQVNLSTIGSQALPVIAVDPSGHFFIVWRSQESDPTMLRIDGRRIDANGLAGDQVAISPTGELSDPDVAPGTGGFLVTWTDRETILGRRIGNSGAPLGSQFQVSTYTGTFKSYPSAAPVGDGFVVVWDSLLQDGDYYGIFARSLEPTS